MILLSFVIPNMALMSTNGKDLSLNNINYSCKRQIGHCDQPSLFS